MEDVVRPPAIVILEWSENFPLKTEWPQIQLRLEHVAGDTRKHYSSLRPLDRRPLTLWLPLYFAFLAAHAAADTVKNGESRRQPHGKWTQQPRA